MFNLQNSYDGRPNTDMTLQSPPGMDLPAPYQLNNQPQPFARGGKVLKHKGMIAAHVSPHELTIMDHLQGGQEHGPAGARSYSGLEALLKNPHIVQSIHHHAKNSGQRQHHAQGGLTSQMEHLREGGREGDTELAFIGPNTHHLFNQLAGHATMNPNTGHPEYFSIGGALNGLWNTIKGGASTIGNWLGGAAKSAPQAIKNVAQAAAPSVGQMATEALGNRYGDMGQMAGNMLNQGAQSMLGAPSENMNPYYQSIGQGLGQAAQSYGRGANANQAFGQGMQQIGSQFGGGFGDALAESGQTLKQGGGWGQAARAGANRGYNDFGGREGLYNTAGNIAQGGFQGGMRGARQAAGDQMSQYMQRAMPQFNQPYNSYQQQQPDNPYENYMQQQYLR